jgi:crotonobetainyl-CoA:carnitine CoA-transferase CaiB-like acyl-CoA transferase
MLVKTEHPYWGTIHQVGSPFKVGDVAERPHVKAPGLDDDRQYVLRELLEYPAERIALMLRGGAFGSNDDNPPD